ncbi:disease resistance protein RGA5-like isoform X2 [Oryza glaberrima]|uniref:disease resistance protein RGA5-like isoform X2 n=1 Tax=Oryza glaberrima TaxID=4538 RepID=UPI00224C5A17|nr:disease resistance protein RGA5-like isoform X2 [Oryza glaberrima]
MDSATGAMGSLLLKLSELAMDEYNLQKGVKKNVEALRRELESMQVALRKVGDVPYDQLGEEVNLWARDVRELSYDAEDVVDSFMVRVDDQGSKGMVKKVAGRFGKAKARHDIADEIKDIMERAREVAARRDRNKAELVGIDEACDDLIKALTMEAEGLSNQQLKVISIAGPGGLGKTTLAREVWDRLKPKFECTAFVAVSSTSNIEKVFKDMLLELDKTKYKDIHNLVRDEKQLIDELRDFLNNKRYFIVIDDIWDIPSWTAIRCALVENNAGSRIIATTRDFSIAEQIGISHGLKALTPESSKKLFYGKIFGSEDKCPMDFVEVSEKILNKCGNVPLAIVTIASVLAAANTMRNPTNEWNKVYTSIGSGLGNNHDVKNMRKILSLSYYSLPSHLRTCFLYISIFPEDYKIERSRLVRMWIDEGFIEPEKDGDNLFELGYSYFYELINRSLIRPLDYDSCVINSCSVHDMILDLVRSLSTKENFVTVLGDILQQTSPASKAHRLSLQNSKLELTTTQTNLKMSKVRSISIFSGSGISLLPSLSSFQVLRVLDLENCDLKEGCHLDLKHVCNLFHLRYLRLYECNYDRELPKEIEKLKFLQTLIVTSDVRLPSTIVELRRLMFLQVTEDTILPEGMGNLTSLEVLSSIDIGKSPNFGKELRNLTKLRELELWWDEMDKSLEEVWIESLCNLHEIQNLRIFAVGDSSLDFLGERWMPSGRLWRFVTGVSCLFTIVPVWIRKNPSLLTNLTDLNISLQQLRQEDLKALGRLPTLLSLDLDADKSECLLTCAGEFCCLILFNLRIKDSLQLTFQLGALPRVETVCLGYFSVQDTRDGGNVDFVVGLENLLSLEFAYVDLRRTTGTIDSDMESAKSALRHAAQLHPNHPTLEIMESS